MCAEIWKHIAQSPTKRMGIFFSLVHLVCSCRIKWHVLQIALINNQAERGKNKMTGSRDPGLKRQNSSKDIVLKKHDLKTIHERERLE